MYDLINKMKQPIEISGGVKEEEILKFEKVLNVTFGYKYKQFLKKFGCLTVKYLEFYGICGENNSIPSAIHATLELRKYKNDFPDNLIVIFEVGDGTVYCIDSLDKVYKVDRHEIIDMNIYFDQFLVNSINEAGK